MVTPMLRVIKTLFWSTNPFIIFSKKKKKKKKTKDKYKQITGKL